MKKSKYALLAISFLLMTGCSNLSNTEHNSHEETTNVTPSPKPDPLPPKVEVPTTVQTKATISAIGDILIHSSVYKDAEQSDGTYNFNPMFDEIEKSLQAADILVANQETMIGGKSFGLSGYPAFNSPHEVGDALKESGVDFVTLANNHTLDRGEKVIQSALTHWDSLNMPYAGSYKDGEDAKVIRIMTKNDITFSFLSYSYGTNGIPIPEGKPHLVNLIDVEKIQKDVEEAKKLSEVIVVSMHWGQEYQPLPNEEQKHLAQQLADMGVHIVIGHHPHVLQPPAWVTGKDGNQTYVMYSLGNFLSSQDQIDRLFGGIGSIEVVKKTTGDKKEIILQNPSFLPTYNYYKNWRNFKIIPMDTMTTNERLNNAAQHYQEIQNHMKTFVPELAFPASL